jgi:RNA polymerase sigma factor (sigma-70 family)
LQREALILATYEELSLQEIAQALAVEVGTVKARLHRARENLKRMLAPYRPGNARSAKEYGTAR